VKETTIRKGSFWACGLLTIFALIALTQTAVSAPVLNPANGHYYEVITSGDITWLAAYQAATASSYLGNSGYLATVTSASEHSFVAALLPGGVQHWIGGYQAAGGSEPGGGWTWDTTEPWSYTNWGFGQPDNNGTSCGEEDFLTIWGYAWNDEDDPGCPCHGGISGYVVEYGGATGSLSQPLGGGNCGSGGGGSSVPALGARGVLLWLGLLGLGAWLVRRRASRKRSGET